MNEKSLHSALKLWYKKPEDQLEVSIDNSIIDIVRDNLLIEIQTKNFSTIKKKLEILYKWIVYIEYHLNKVIRKRLSPRHSLYLDIFEELVRIPELIAHPNLTIELPLVQIEEYRTNDGKGIWMKKVWSICEKRLVNVLERKIFCSPIDFLLLKPTSPKHPFTSAELANSIGKPLGLAQKMNYCSCKMGILRVIGKSGRSLLFNY